MYQIDSNRRKAACPDAQFVGEQAGLPGSQPLQGLAATMGSTLAVVLVVIIVCAVFQIFFTQLRRRHVKIKAMKRQTFPLICLRVLLYDFRRNVQRAGDRKATRKRQQRNQKLAAILLVHSPD